MDMNIHTTTSNQFTNYSDKSVTIKNNSYTENVVVTNNEIEEFADIAIKDIEIEHLANILDDANKPDLIIFGTGSKIVYPNPKLLLELQKNSIGVEIMPIQALCRTFNFLISEDRKIAAILLFDKD